MAEKFVPNFKVKYTETVAPELFKEFGYTSCGRSNNKQEAS